MSVREVAGGTHGGAPREPKPAPGGADEATHAADTASAATGSSERSRRPWVAGALGATWALFVGLALLSCLVLAVWALSSTPAGDSAAAWRAVGITWLGAHQTSLTISGLPVTVLPLGALLPGLLLTRRGGGWSARLVPEPSLPEIGALVGGAVLAYGAGGTGVAWLSSTPRTGATLLGAFVACGAVAAAGSLWGIAREIDLLDRVAERVSAGIWRTLVAGWASALGLFVLGAGLVALSLIVHVADAARALGAIDGGILAAAGLTLVNVLTLPTLAVWGAALAAGPGFSLGHLGSLSAFGGEVGALPALPVLVTIPQSVPGWAPLLLAGPVVCGVIAGRIRWRADVPSWPGALLTGLGVVAVLTPFVVAGVLLTSGSVGGGALSQVGPELGPATAATVGLVLLGFLGEAAGQSLKLWWDLHRAEQRGLRTPDDPESAQDPDGQDPVASDAGSDTAQAASDAIEATSPEEVVAPAARSGAPVAAGRSLVASVWAVGSTARSRVVWGAPTQAADSPVDDSHSDAGPVRSDSGARADEASRDGARDDGQTTVAIPRQAVVDVVPAPVVPDPLEAESEREPGSDPDAGGVHFIEAIPRGAGVEVAPGSAPAPRSESSSNVLDAGGVHITEAIPRPAGVEVAPGSAPAPCGESSSDVPDAGGVHITEAIPRPAGVEVAPGSAPAPRGESSSDVPDSRDAHSTVAIPRPTPATPGTDALQLGDHPRMPPP